jgi:hypothetical protein
MRMSCDTSDPGYRAFIEAGGHGGKVVVYLDDVEQTECITADEEEGFVLRHVTDAAGDIVLNEARTETLKERATGKVRIEVQP